MHRDEKGSAFLLVVFMMLLFTMIGVAVLGATIGGATRTQKSEDNLQTIHLADKALSEAMAHIMARFDNQSISPSEMTKEVEQFVKNFNGYDTRNSDLDPAKKPSYQIQNLCILGHTNDPSLKNTVYCPNQADSANQENTEPYLTTLRITAEAEVNGAKRDLVQDVTLDTFPDFLKYAMGSEGNVFINGAPAFKGNIYAGEQLAIRNAAKYTYNDADLLQQTQYLYVDPVQSSALDNIYVAAGDDLGNGKIQIERQDDLIIYDAAGNEIKDVDFHHDQFHGLDTKIELTETKKFISIDIAQSFVDKAFDSLGEETPLTTWDDLSRAYKIAPLGDKANALFNQLRLYYHSNRMIVPPTAPSLPAGNATNEETEAYNAEKAKYDQAVIDLNNQLSNLSGAYFVDGNFTLGDQLTKVNYGIKGKHDWLVVNGDLTIQNDDPHTALPIRANILVKGKVTLKGNLEMDSTIFSLEDQQSNEIIDAQIRGTGLVMIANGPIEIYRVDSFQDIGTGYKKESTNTLDAFFYTDKEAELYGVGSLFWIHGGFFAKDQITINAVLGNTTDPNGIALDFETQVGLDQDHARFVIDYNKGIFASQVAGLPRVNKIRVNIGQKKLIPIHN